MTRPLTARQRFVLQLLAGDGKTDVEVGAALHERPPSCRYCWPGYPCVFAATTGRDVLIALRNRGLTIRRKTGLWQVRADAELPLELFGEPSVEPASDPIPY